MDFRASGALAMPGDDTAAGGPSKESDLTGFFTCAFLPPDDRFFRPLAAPASRTAVRQACGNRRASVNIATMRVLASDPIRSIASFRLPVPSYDMVHYGSVEDGYRQLCTQCFNADVAARCGLDRLRERPF